jgi:hypothetical protein
MSQAFQCQGRRRTIAAGLELQHLRLANRGDISRLFAASYSMDSTGVKNNDVKAWSNTINIDKGKCLSVGSI